MSRKYKFGDPDGLFFVSFAVVYWIDVFIKNEYKGFQFWQQDNHPIQLETNEMMQQKLDYIHNNPVEAGFVDSPEDYLYSSARDYAGEKGLIAISFID